MVAVVSGSGLGVSNSSRFTVGAGGEQGQGALGWAGERVTVNAASGNLVIQSQDGQLAGIGIGADVALLRTYKSQDDNGDAWRLGYHRRITGLTGRLNAAGSTLKRTDVDGHRVLSVPTFQPTFHEQLPLTLRQFIQLCFALALCTVLAACGGGGGGTPAGSSAPASIVITVQPSDTTVVEGANAIFSW